MTGTLDYSMAFWKELKGENDEWSVVEEEMKGEQV